MFQQHAKKKKNPGTDMCLLKNWVHWVSEISSEGINNLISSFLKWPRFSFCLPAWQLPLQPQRTGCLSTPRSGLGRAAWILFIGHGVGPSDPGDGRSPLMLQTVLILLFSIACRHFLFPFLNSWKPVFFKIRRRIQQILTPSWALIRAGKEAQRNRDNSDS